VVEPGEDELVDGRYLRAVAVGEPPHLRDFGGGLDGARVAQGPAAGYTHRYAGGVAVGGRFKGASVG
jgi:hypothetical protein